MPAIWGRCDGAALVTGEGVAAIVRSATACEVRFSEPHDGHYAVAVTPEQNGIWAPVVTNRTRDGFSVSIHGWNGGTEARVPFGFIVVGEGL